MVACPGPGNGAIYYPNQEIVARVEERRLADMLEHRVKFVFNLRNVCH